MSGVMGVLTALVMTALPAGEEEGRMYVGVAVPLAPDGFALEAEQERDDGFSVTLGLRVAFNLGKWIPVFEDADPDSLRLGLEPGARFYLKGPVLEGLWVGPRLEVVHAWVDTGVGTRPESRTRTVWQVGGAVLSGYSFRFGEGFTVQASLGLGALYRPPIPGFSLWTVTVAPRAQVSLGWSL
ncbi:uncharacterized protein DUF3575 [Archangium gephyra]|uniref:Uncharacterized protein DUF3575 n=1 Tax=Archangium gephyra TaxID=48 RepID=A0AAC8TAQ3_9BACT|nr:DUF3575 domain-containing protein [Archangium gephyra]AKI98857.1 Hypothetical protein AA314_00484 [Archangium gephyra]REG30775.1 uncharacterized protein DUF3575 [Archangium gephyra]